MSSPEPESPKTAEIALLKETLAAVRDESRERIDELVETQSVTDGVLARLTVKNEQLTRANAELTEQRDAAVQDITDKSGASYDGLSKKARHVVGRPATFSDMTRDTDVRDWLSSMQNYLQLTSAPSDEYVPIASTYLGGVALKYYQNEIVSDYRPGQAMDWKHFSDRMEEVFSSRADDVRARHDLDKLTQTGTVGEYTRRFKLLLSKLSSNPLSEADKVYLYRKGLNETLKDKTFFVPGLSSARVQNNFLDLTVHATTVGLQLEATKAALEPLLASQGFRRPDTNRKRPLPGGGGGGGGGNGGNGPAKQRMNAPATAETPPANPKRLWLAKNGCCFQCEYAGHMAGPKGANCDSENVNGKWILGELGAIAFAKVRKDRQHVPGAYEKSLA
jgi:uncharacterized protein YdbL (DUF1318 family)